MGFELRRECRKVERNRGDVLGHVGEVSRWTLIVNVRLSSVYGSSDQPLVRGWGITFVEALRYGMRGLGNLDDFLTN